MYIYVDNAHFFWHDQYLYKCNQRGDQGQEVPRISISSSFKVAVSHHTESARAIKSCNKLFTFQNDVDEDSQGQGQGGGLKVSRSVQNRPVFKF